MAKFHLLFGYAVNKKMHLGTLEISEGIYTWTYSDDYLNHKVNPYFYEVPGLPRGQIHTADSLFWFFQDRIPPRSRKDWLERMGLDKYDELEVLRRGGLRLRADAYELVEDDS